jgi:uncharacterized membrane protein
MTARHKIVWILRACSFLGLLVLLFRPELTRTNIGSEGQWAILMDTSASMAVEDPRVRLDQAKKILPQFKRQGFESRLFQFGENLRSLAPAEIDGLKPSAPASNLAKALSSLPEHGRFPGAVVLTDGRQVGPGDPVSAAAVWGKPLFLIGVGSRSAFQDAALRRIQAPPFAFKNIPTQISVVVAASGLNGKTIKIKFREGSDLIKTEELRIDNEDFEAAVPFTWIPDSVGEKRLTAEIEPAAGEITPRNNRQDVSIQVGRDRFRVLYLCGSPGPEYNFLRYQLKSDPAVELVTFVILRNASNVISVPEQELSLIPFPTQDMIVQQLPSFDVIIFEDFSFWEYGLTPALLVAIRKRVAGGGGFLMLGGPRSLGPGSLYAHPDIEPLLSISLTGAASSGSSEFKFAPKIPSHPLMRMEANVDKNLKIWNALPSLEDVLSGPTPKPGATVVAEAATGNASKPLLVVQSLQKGRTATMLTRTTWRWSMIPGSADQGSDVYARFWKNMILWLSRAEENKLVRLGLEQKNARVGEPSPVRIWVYDEYFKPVQEADVRLTLRDPSGEEAELIPVRETEGVYAASWTPQKTGPHRFQTYVKRNGVRYGDDALNAIVLEGQREEDDLRPDFSTLQAMADVSGGAFTSADDFRPEFVAAFEKTALKSSSRKILIWNSPFVLGWIILCLGVEWFIRKKMGLP